MTYNKKFIPYARQEIDEADILAVLDVLRGDYLTTGPAVDEFENKLCEVTDASFSVSCSSGTAALHLATGALNLGPGDQVVVPSITFLSTANAVRYVGAEVRFSDVNPSNGLMEAQHLEEVILEGCENIKAIIPVHLTGQVPDMDALSEIAGRHGIRIIEDAAHSLGASYYLSGKERAVGNCAISDMTAFSFHPVKNITTGEGGAVTTNNPDLAKRLRTLRNIGMIRDPDQFILHKDAFDNKNQPNPWFYEMHELGFNYRSSDIHCALGISQLSKLNQNNEKRRQLAEHYDNQLLSLSPRVRPIHRIRGCRSAWHLYSVLIDFQDIGISRSETMAQLRKLGIGTQVHYIPVHTQPYYHRLYGDQNLPGAMAYYARCLSLPLHVAMTNGDVERVVDELKSILT